MSPRLWLISFFVTGEDVQNDFRQRIVKDTTWNHPSQIVQEWQYSLDPAEVDEYHFNSATEIIGELTDMDIEILNNALTK